MKWLKQIIMDKILQFLKKVLLLKIIHLITAKQCLRTKIAIRKFNLLLVLEVIKLKKWRNKIT